MNIDIKIIAMTILKSAPRITGHPTDLDQFEKEWSHWTAGPAPKAWAVQDMFFVMSTRLKPGPVPCGDPLGMVDIFGIEKQQ